MTDPTSAACTAVYGASTALPTVLAGNKSLKLCHGVDIFVIFASDISDNCILMQSDRVKSQVSKSFLTTNIYIGKCSEATCSGLSSCMSDPTSAACTAVYGAAASLPSVLAGDYF